MLLKTFLKYTIYKHKYHQLPKHKYSNALFKRNSSSIFVNQGGTVTITHQVGAHSFLLK